MTKPDDLIGPTTRRAFLLGLTAAAALPALPKAAAQTRGPAPSANQETAPPNPAEIDALMAIVTLRYGTYLKSDEVPMVRRALERQQANIDALYKVPIHNGDAPDFLFIPDGV